jgi:uncharacterized protein (DUF2336 family)
VAMPILRYCPVLTDTVLMGIISGTQNTMRLIAIAERDFVSVTVSQCLVEKQQEPVTLSLLNNMKAELSDDVFELVADLSDGNNSLIQSMMRRTPVPMTSINRLMDKQKQKAAQQQDNVPGRLRSFSAVDTVSLEEEMTQVLTLTQKPNRESCIALAEEYNRGGRLSTNLLLLALALGYKEFFAACMQKQTHLPYTEVLKMLDGQDADFKMLFNKSRISSALYPLIFYAKNAMDECLKVGMLPGSQRICAKMADRLIDAESSGVNFAGTIGRPIATVLLKHYQ